MSTNVDISVNEVDQTARVRVTAETGETVDLSLDAAGLGRLIATLGDARRALAEKLPVPPIEGSKFVAVYRTNWALQIDALTEGSLFAFQHPAYGPIGVVFSPPDSEKIIKGLQRHRSMIHSSPDSANRPS